MPGYGHKGRGCSRRSLGLAWCHSAGGHPGNLSLGMRPLESVSDAAGLASRIKEKLASLILSGKQMLNALFFPDFWAKFSFCECLGKS